MRGLESLLREQVQRHGTLSELAKAIRMSQARLGRVINYGGSLEVANLLRLAVVSGEPASDVLRAAKKDDVADLIEELYGKPNPPLSPADRTLLEQWHALPPDARDTVGDLIERLVEKGTRKRQQRTA